MPETALSLIGLLTIALVAGLLAGWLVRSRRSQGEKAAINAGWKEQITALRGENERLAEQNRRLVQQNSQYQASSKDSGMRATELSSALKEAFGRRDELQRQIKDVRGNLETAVRERDQLKSAIESRAVAVDDTATAIRQRDERIAQLAKELKNWQERIPPLIERFRVRNRQALELEEQLAESRDRIGVLEATLAPASASDERGPSGEDLPAADESTEPVEQVNASGAGPTADSIPSRDVEFATPAEPRATETGIDTNPAIAGEFGRDDLKSIKGVGPAIEKTLNEMGIWRFSQIAAMSEFEMDRIAQRLKGFRSRIYREDWIGQARELEERKSGGKR